MLRCDPGDGGPAGLFRRRLGIIGLGTYLPERVVTNDELAGSLNTSDTWIRSRLGISRRHRAEPQDTTALMACEAAREALADANLAPEQIGLIIVATSTPDMPLPPVACAVQRALGAKRAVAFDVSSVCAGFVFALNVAFKMMQTERRGTAALVIGSDAYSRILDWTDRKTCVIFGDGAGAVVVGDTESGRGIRNSCLKSDGDLFDLVTCPPDSSGRYFFHMQGRAVFEYAVTEIPALIEQVVTGAGDRLTDVDRIVPHQANSEIIRECLGRLGVTADRAVMNIDRVGNTASASIPLALQDGRNRRLLKRDDRVVLVAVGGGMSAGAIYLDWCLDGPRDHVVGAP